MGLNKCTVIDLSGLDNNIPTIKARKFDPHEKFRVLIISPESSYFSPNVRKQAKFLWYVNHIGLWIHNYTPIKQTLWTQIIFQEQETIISQLKLTRYPWVIFFLLSRSNTVLVVDLENMIKFSYTLRNLIILSSRGNRVLGGYLHLRTEL